jgi:hypothetical protein
MLAACGDSATDSFGGFRNAASSKQCRQYFHCDQGDSDAEIDRVVYSESDCGQAGPSGYSARIEAYIRAGTVRYDQQAADACLASFSDLCAGGEAEICEDVLTGLVLSGGSCDASVQCASRECNATANTCGACSLLLTLGANCDVPNTQCPENSYCSFEGFCTAYTGGDYAVSQVGLNAPCGEISANVYAVCAPDLICSETNVCTARLAVGLRCDEDDDSCAYGSTCVYDGALDESRCRTISTTSLVGADCGSTTATTYVACNEDARLYCGENETCVRLAGNGEIGSQCNDDLDCNSRICAYGGGDNLTCVAPNLPVGSACISVDQCRSGDCKDLTASSSVCAEVVTCN